MTRGTRPTLLAFLSIALTIAGLATVVLAVSTRGGTIPGPLPILPADNWWNLEISNAPVDPASANYISFIGATRRAHPDFGGDVSPGSVQGYGFPYAVVDSAVPLRTVQFQYSDESDGVDHATDQSFPFYPIPDEAITQAHWIEGGDPGNVDLRDSSDRHVLIFDPDRRYLYELYNVFHDGSQWHAGSGARFDLDTNTRRPDGWTSADAAGLAILPGLVRYDEVFGADEIRHAFRVTVRATNGYVYPASHRAGSSSGALPMGARLRLKASKNLSTFTPEVQKIFRAMQRYGLIVADNGSDLYVSGTYDTRWSNDVLNPAFSALTASDFEVITLGYQAISPSITAQPANQTAVPGESTEFAIAASGATAYQWQVSTNGGASWTALANTSPYSGAGTVTLAVASVTSGLNGALYRCVASNSAGTATSSAATLTIVQGPALGLERTTLTFGAVNTAGTLSHVSPAQQARLFFVGASPSWTATSNAPWIQVTAGSGTGGGQFTVGIVSHSTLPATGHVTGTVTVAAGGVVNSPRTLTVKLTLIGGTSAAPFGSLDTPANNASGLIGSIPVTGWALDDVGVQRVEIWRNCVDAIDRPAGACFAATPGGAANFVFIGTGAFLSGARPDVETAFPTTPVAYRAGWGYLMATNALPHMPSNAAQGGQGTFTLTAYAIDVEGHYTSLGQKTITLDNDHATIPFGTIDTPDQGATVTTSVSANFGWAMTQIGKCIDTSSTLSYKVYIDGVSRTLTPGVNWFAGLNRSDIEAAYPGRCNSTSALAAYYIDADALGLANGLHTIGWDVIDDQGKIAGIGSRFFIVSR